MDSKRIKAPWTQEQVDNLNSRQQRKDLHPYTCGIDSSHPWLVATTSGWKCAPTCGYTQYWAHAIDGEAPDGQ